MGIIVQKFGGTSVADLARIRNVATIIEKETKKNNKVIAVVSAMAGVTNNLITKCNTISSLKSSQSIREYDAAIASGEIITSSLLAMQLLEMGIDARSLQGWQAGITTDSNHGNAEITNINTNYLNELLDQNITPIITGFQGVSAAHDVSTLGKGGSDTSAAFIAGELKADRCDIYTDVCGIYSADPRLINNAHKIPEINIEELCALCVGGAKVLHQRSALAAKKYNLKMRVLSSFEDNSGTLVTKEYINKPENKVRAITSNKNLLQIDIPNKNKETGQHLEKLFRASKIEIKEAYSADENIIFIINLSDKNKAEQILDGFKKHSRQIKYKFSSKISSICLVSCDINKSNIIDQTLEILNKNKIEIFYHSVSDVSVTVIIDDYHNEKAIKILHEYFF